MSYARRLQPGPKRSLRSSHVADFDVYSMVEADTGPGRHSGGTWMYRCPAPNHEDRTPSFALRRKDDRWVWHCHGACNRGGDAADYLVLTGRSTDQADGLRWLREQAGDYAPIAPAFPILPVSERTSPMPEPEPVPDADKHMQRFLDRRGLTRWVVDAYRLRVVRDDYGTMRVRFPWLTPTGHTIFGQDRAIDESKLRWVSPKGRPCPRPFGIERFHVLEDLRTNPTDFDHGLDVFVVEGLTDCVSLVDGLQRSEATAATVTVGLPGGQLRKNWEPLFVGYDVFLITDNDEAGLAKRTDLTSRLHRATSVTQVFVPKPHNDIASWRHTVGEEFPDQFVSVVADALQNGM